MQNEALAAPAAKANAKPMTMLGKAAARLVHREGALAGSAGRLADPDAAGDVAPTLDSGAAAAAAQVQIIRKKQEDLLEKQQKHMRKVEDHKESLRLDYIFLMKTTRGTTMRDARRYMSQVLEKDSDLVEAFGALRRWIVIVRAAVSIAQALTRMALHDLQELQGGCGRRNSGVRDVPLCSVGCKLAFTLVILHRVGRSG